MRRRLGPPPFSFVSRTQSICALRLRRGVAVFLAVLAAFAVLLSPACRRKEAPVPIDADRLAEQFAAAARDAVGTEPPIRIVPATHSGNSAPARVLVSLPDASRFRLLAAAWRTAASDRGITLQPRDSADARAAFTVSSGARTLLVLEVFDVELPPLPPAGSGNAPALAVIVDDLGYDSAAARAVLALPARVTVAVLPNLPDSPAIAEEAHRRGIQVLLHLPMESVAGEDKAEKIELHVGEPAGEVDRVLDEMLATVPHAAGVNNHQGSRATSNAALMAALAAALRARGLFFIDSRTAPNSLAYEAARRAGVPAAARNIFLDDDEQPAAVRRQLERAEKLSREQGWCVAIGHPHPATVEVLAEMLPEIEARGVRLVSASDLLGREPVPR